MLIRPGFQGGHLWFCNGKLSFWDPQVLVEKEVCAPTVRHSRGQLLKSQKNSRFCESMPKIVEESIPPSSQDLAKSGGESLLCPSR